MVTLMPNIPDMVPNPGQFGEFLFLMDRSLFQDAQVPPEEVFRGWNFPHGSCPTGEDSGKLLHVGRCSAQLLHLSSAHPSVCSQNTLLFLLKSLPLACYFNIYSFGATFKAFYP